MTAANYNLGGIKHLDDSGEGMGPFTPYVAVVAGTAILGKVGIDQTTPGTTNGVQAKITDNSGNALDYSEPLQTQNYLLAATDLSQARVNNSGASGDLTVVAAVASQTTRVHRMRLSAVGATVITIKQGSTTLEVFNLGALGSVVLAFNDRPHYTTAVNATFIVSSSAATQVDGVVDYITSA